MKCSGFHFSVLRNEADVLLYTVICPYALCMACKLLPEEQLEQDIN